MVTAAVSAALWRRLPSLLGSASIAGAVWYLRREALHAAKAAPPAVPSPPRLRQQPRRLAAVYGDDRYDEYGWVRHADPDPHSALGRYLAREWDYAEAALEAHAGLLRELEQEVRRRSGLFAHHTTTVNSVEVVGAANGGNGGEKCEGSGGAASIGEPCFLFGAELDPVGLAMPVVVRCSRAGEAGHDGGSGSGSACELCRQCEVVLDPNALLTAAAYAHTGAHSGAGAGALGKGRQQYFRVPSIQVSRDGRLAAFLVDTTGREQYDLCVVPLGGWFGSQAPPATAGARDAGGDGGAGPDAHAGADSCMSAGGAKVTTDSRFSSPVRVVASDCGGSFAWVRGGSEPGSSSNGSSADYSLLYTSVAGPRQAVRCAIFPGTAALPLAETACSGGYGHSGSEGGNVDVVAPPAAPSPWPASSQVSPSLMATVVHHELCTAASAAAHFEVWESRTGRVVFVSEATHEGNSLRFVETHGARAPRPPGTHELSLTPSWSVATATTAAAAPPLRFVRPPNAAETVDAQDWGDNVFILHIGAAGGYSSIRYAPWPSPPPRTGTGSSEPPHAVEQDARVGKDAAGDAAVALDGWDRVWDEAFQRHYYYHRPSDTSVWELPSDGELRGLADGRTLSSSPPSDEVVLLEFRDDGAELAALPHAAPRVIGAEGVFATASHLCYRQRTSQGRTEFVWHRLLRSGEGAAAGQLGPGGGGNGGCGGGGGVALGLQLGAKRTLTASQLLDVALAAAHGRGRPYYRQLVGWRCPNSTTVTTAVVPPTAALVDSTDQRRREAPVMVIEDPRTFPAQLFARPVAASARPNHTTGSRGSGGIGALEQHGEEDVLLSFSTFAAPGTMLRLRLEGGSLTPVFCARGAGPTVSGCGGGVAVAVAVAGAGASAGAGAGAVAGAGAGGRNDEFGDNSPYCQLRVWVPAPRNVPGTAPPPAAVRVADARAAATGDGHSTVSIAPGSANDCDGDCANGSEDGAVVYVPVSLVYHRDRAALDGSAPALVRVYGCYGAADPLAFRGADLSLLDRGVVLAHAHVRGGGELGGCWHDEGRHLLKRNAVSDLRACLEALQGFGDSSGCGGGGGGGGPGGGGGEDGNVGTDDHNAGGSVGAVDGHARGVESGGGSGGGLVARGRVALQGFSAGGLVAAALVNAAPHLVRALVLESPFLDPLGAMLDPSLPLVVAERGEWCDPLASQECYFYLRSYSPYDNVAAAVAAAAAAAGSGVDHRTRQSGGADVAGPTSTGSAAATHGTGGAGCPSPPFFPDVLITANALDARVMFWDPVKFANRLRVALATTAHQHHQQQRRGDGEGRAAPSPPLVLLRVGAVDRGGGHAENHNGVAAAAAEAFAQTFVLSRIAS